MIHGSTVRAQEFKKLRKLQHIVSTKQEIQMSKLLSGYTSGTTTKTSCRKTANIEVTYSSNSETQQAMILISGAFINGGNFSININTVNQSPTLTLEEEPRQSIVENEALPKWKRLKPLEDSDDEF